MQLEDSAEIKRIFLVKAPYVKISRMSAAVLNKFDTNPYPVIDTPSLCVVAFSHRGSKCNQTLLHSIDSMCSLCHSEPRCHCMYSISTFCCHYISTNTSLSKHSFNILHKVECRQVKVCVLAEESDKRNISDLVGC